MDFEYLGPYRIEGILGRGGMGTVYRAVHAKSNDVVAVKVIASTLADQERFRRRFAAEVETLKRLQHPHIVQLIGYGEEHGHLFYSMEFVNGVSLQEQLRKSGKLPWKRVLQICTQVCSALKQAHDLGIIHRDLKPANIMIDQAGEVKLTDFGIAKLFGSLENTAAGAVIGTADFMPPEQAEGKTVTSRSDLYAVGSLAYACLTGRAPFSGNSIPEVLYAVRYNPPPPIRSYVHDVPSELIELIEELLRKDPNDRPPTALVVTNRLKTLRLGLERREQFSASNPLIEKAGGLSELTSIDFDALSQNDPKLESLRGAPEDRTMAIPGRAAEQEPLAALPTRPPSAGPEEATRVATPSAIESDFEENEAPIERMVGDTHFKIVEEEERRRATHYEPALEPSSEWKRWVSIAMLASLLFVCVFALWYFSRPRSADAIVAEIQVAIENGDDAKLLDAAPWIEELRERFPDDERLAAFQKIETEIQIIRTSRSLLRRARMEGGTSNLDPLEQAFLDCVQAKSQNIATAESKIEAFLTVFSEKGGSSDRQRKLVDLARHLQQEIRKEPHDRLHPAAERLQDQMRWAATELPKDLRPKFYRSIIELYKEKPWAQDIVQNAELAIEAIEGSKR